MRKGCHKFSVLIRVLADFRVLAEWQVNRYFQLKSETPHALSSNVVYQFTCSCDTNLSYIGMTTQHLGTRTGEHLNLDDSHKNAMKDHLRYCRQCCNGV